MLKVSCSLTSHRQLVTRLDRIKQTACGDGHSHCLLCGQQFGLMGISSVMCEECKKVSVLRLTLED